MPEAPFPATVVGITDGDTLAVVHGGQRDRVRLRGIDCPEKGQAYGRNATQAASALVVGQRVTIKAVGHDQYGRTLGEVALPDGRRLNDELVREGWCWWYRRYAPGNATLEQLEAEARSAKRGLWRDPHPMPPWVFRHLTHENHYRRHSVSVSVLP